MRAILIVVSVLALGAAPLLAEASGHDGRRTSSAHAACKPTKPKSGKDDGKKRKGTKTTKTAPDEPEEDAPDERAPEPAPAPAASKDKGDDEGRTLQRGERVEFDARLIQGQTAKAGAVYLFARVPTNLKSMVRERTSFREKIIRTIYPEEEAP